MKYGKCQYYSVFSVYPTFSLNFCISFSLVTFSITPPRLLSFSSNRSYPRWIYTISSTIVIPSAASPAIHRAAPARRSGALTRAPENRSTPSIVAEFPSTFTDSAHTRQLAQIFKTVLENTLRNRTGSLRQRQRHTDLGLHICRIIPDRAVFLPACFFRRPLATTRTASSNSSTSQPDVHQLWKSSHPDASGSRSSLSHHLLSLLRQT